MPAHFWPFIESLNERNVPIGRDLYLSIAPTWRRGHLISSGSLRVTRRRRTGGIAAEGFAGGLN